MNDKALVIQDSHSQVFDCDAFMNERNLIAEYCCSRLSALSAFKSKRYRCVVMSMDMQNDDPLAIIQDLRNTETKLGLPKTQLLVTYKMRQPTQSEISQFNISGQIRSHRMP
jgi:ActR/RegA family two-component response regulator